MRYPFLFSFFIGLISPIFADVSLEEKVGQLLMVSFMGDRVNEEARELVQDVNVGGVIYYNWANDLSDPERVLILSMDLQSLAKTPLLIAVDQEGGRVQRLHSTRYPSNGDAENPGEMAFQMGRELSAVGINMNLAPVVDVNSNPLNPVIGDRSFSSDPYRVAVAGKQALDGYKKTGVIATLKHFPGHGDTSIDSHEDLPILNKTVDELEQTELIPFRALSPFVDAIMTAHILVPEIDPEFPATTSKKALNFLRKDLGFDGVIVSDSLAMMGILKRHSLEEAAILAINAGCDLLIIGGAKLLGVDHFLTLTPIEIKGIHSAICKAVLQGEIPMERIDESYARVQKLKSSVEIPSFFR